MVTLVYALLERKQEEKTCFTTTACIWPLFCGTTFAAMLYGIIGAATSQGMTFDDTWEVVSWGFGHFVTAAILCLIACFSVHTYLRWDRDQAARAILSE